MRFLESFVLENQRIRNILSQVSELKGHQGSVIRYSDNFLRHYCQWKMNPRYFRNLEDFFNFPPFRRFPFLDFGGLSQSTNWSVLSTYIPKIYFQEIQDFKDMIQRIDRTGILLHELSPIELVISIFNDADATRFDNVISEYNNEQYDFRVIIERRGRNVFLSDTRSVHDKIKGGLSIGAGDSKYFGTLGGILRSKNNLTFGLTCAHVVDKSNGKVFQPARTDSKKAREIGTVEISSNINWSQPFTPCNPRFQASNPPNMDASLIALNSDVPFEQSVHNLGKITGTRAFDDIHQCMEVEFNGRSTGERKRLLVGGLCVSYKIAYRNDDISNEDRLACFTSLIELRELDTFQVGRLNIQGMPVKEGDSGSWICSNDQNGYNWCGMLISGDNDRGYFIAAEDINSWLKSEGYELEPSEVFNQNHFVTSQIHETPRY